MFKLAERWDPSRLAAAPASAKGNSSSMPGCHPSEHTQRGTCPSLSRGRRGRGAEEATSFPYFHPKSTT